MSFLAHGHLPEHHGIHLPSWMHTLIRRTAPHRALARNSLSSGVTTSARNMAAQQCLPPARGGREEQSQISAPVKGKVQQIRLRWRCSALQTVSTGLLSVTGGKAQATRTVSCAHGKATRSPLPNLAPRGRLLAPGYYSTSVTCRPKNQLLIRHGSRYWSSNRTRGQVLLSGFIHVAEQIRVMKTFILSSQLIL